MLEVALAIPYWLELAATISGAIFGALSAVRAKYDIFGVCCIAIVVGLAGGITRDILLQDYGLYAFQKPNLILALTWCPPSSWAPSPPTAAASCATSA